MLKKIIYSTLLFITFSDECVHAQSVGSISSYGGSFITKSVSLGGTSTDVSETVYIGPGTHAIEGTWAIYARQVVIDPNALISGNGVIEYYNPTDAGGIASITLLDGNASTNSVDVNIRLQNNSGAQLTELPFPIAHTASGWVNNTSSATLYTGRNLSLAVDGADIILGSGIQGDLRFDNDATISNYRPSRMIITNNSLTSHVVKEDFTSAFIFPVGILDGDYTPAEISNASSNTVHLSVQDYSASTAPESTTDPGPGGVPADGMQRTWHIYGDVPSVASMINLQHNLSTNQSGFTDLSHFVTQWGPTAPNTSGDLIIPYSTSSWQSNTSGAGSVGNLVSPLALMPGTSMRSRNYSSMATSALAEESYFTKSADAIHPLPLYFIQHSAVGQSCSVELRWTISSEREAQLFRIMRSSNARDYNTLVQIQARKDVSGYTYLDTEASEKNNYYFIELVNKDGSIVRSSTMSVNLDCPATSIKVYPNPTQNRINIEYSNKNILAFSIYSLDGKLINQVLQCNPQNSKISADIAHLQDGVYFIKVLLDDGTSASFKIAKEPRL